MEGQFNVYFDVKVHAMAQAVSRRLITAESRVQFQARPCEICGGKSGTGTGFSPNTSVFPCQSHSTGATYSFVRLSPTLYNLSN